MNRLRGKFTSCKITRREDLTVDLFKIWLKPLEPFSFKPGQYCTIGVDGLERPYSIVSSPDEEEIELFIEVVPPPEERNSGWVGAVGRINSLVQDFVKAKGLIPSETCIYACGHPQMIEDVNKKFSGTEFEFLEERFWKEDE